MKKDFISTGACFYVLKLQFFSLIVAPRMDFLLLYANENNHKKIKTI